MARERHEAYCRLLVRLVIIFELIRPRRKTLRFSDNVTQTVRLRSTDIEGFTLNDGSTLNTKVFADKAEQVATELQKVAQALQATHHRRGWWPF